MADGYEVHVVPPGSLVVLRGDLRDPELAGRLAAEILRVSAHKEFVVVCLPEGTDLSVVHDPEAVRALTT